MQLKIYYIIAIKETDVPHNWNTAMGGYKISEERMGRRGRGVVLLRKGQVMKSCLWVTAMNRLQACG